MPKGAAGYPPLADTVSWGVTRSELSNEIRNENGSANLHINAFSINYHPLMPKAWVNFNGTGTVAILDSHNVSSITDNGTGSYTVNLDVTLTDANYAPFASSSPYPCVLNSDGNNHVAQNASAFRVYSYSTNQGAQDSSQISAMVMGRI